MFMKTKKKRRLKVNKKINFKNIKLAAAFHGWLPIHKQLKIKKFLNKMQFPCFDALTYAQLAEGRVDIVVQCANKIWDIHPLIPIINASGGITTTWKNKDAKQAGHVAVSSNKIIHKKILNHLDNKRILNNYTQFKKNLKNKRNIPLVGFLYKAQNFLKTKLNFLKTLIFQNYEPCIFRVF